MKKLNILNTLFSSEGGSKATFNGTVKQLNIAKAIIIKSHFDLKLSFGRNITYSNYCYMIRYFVS